MADEGTLGFFGGLAQGLAQGVLREDELKKKEALINFQNNIDKENAQTQFNFQKKLLDVKQSYDLHNKAIDFNHDLQASRMNNLHQDLAANILQQHEDKRNSDNIKYGLGYGVLQEVKNIQPQFLDDNVKGALGNIESLNGTAKDYSLVFDALSKSHGVEYDNEHPPHPISGVISSTSSTTTTGKTKKPEDFYPVAPTATSAEPTIDISRFKTGGGIDPKMAYMQKRYGEVKKQNMQDWITKGKTGTQPKAEPTAAQVASIKAEADSKFGGGKAMSPEQAKSYREQKGYVDLSVETAKSHNIDPNLMLGIMAVESPIYDKKTGKLIGYDATAVNKSSGATGLYQFIPSTRRYMIKQYGIDPYKSPEDNIKAAGIYIDELMKRYNGDVKQVLLHYGDGTQGYVDKVMKAAGYATKTESIGAQAIRMQAGTKKYDVPVEPGTPTQTYYDPKGITNIVGSNPSAKSPLDKADALYDKYYIGPIQREPLRKFLNSDDAAIWDGYWSDWFIQKFPAAAKTKGLQPSGVTKQQYDAVRQKALDAKARYGKRGVGLQNLTQGTSQSTGDQVLSTVFPGVRFHK